ncbi:hypothetical protein Q2T40_08300 [Winogradskyella maritima]|uniref:PH (Pleckstrin Homology) domain-containing protein n=1 Tax=Winogradskyella maritima TaxID=1517766 RepID=A0ABV8AJM2_9FLAO|nr:hypothetical protein [Winogradskyella maritima]
MRIKTQRLTTIQVALIFGVPLLLFSILWILTKSALFNSENQLLSIAISADVLLTVPLIYFLSIRKTKIPRISVVPITIIGLLIGYVILPLEQQLYLNLFKAWALPVIEVGVASCIIFNVYKTLKGFKKEKQTGLDFYDALKAVCEKSLPKAVVPFLITEISVFYYGFLCWKGPKLKDNQFTYHKDSGKPTLLMALIFLIAVETFALHLLIAKYSTVSAWILTGLSIYSGIQILGFLKSIYQRPITIDDDKVYLNYGIMKSTIIPLRDIASIELSTKDFDEKSEIKKFSFLGSLEGHNIILHLSEEHKMTGLYGTSKTYKGLALHVDEKVAFKAFIEHKIKCE